MNRDEIEKLANEHLKEHCTLCGSKMILELVAASKLPDPYGDLLNVFKKPHFDDYDSRGNRLYGIKLICPKKEKKLFGQDYHNMGYVNDGIQKTFTLAEIKERYEKYSTK